MNNNKDNKFNDRIHSTARILTAIVTTLLLMAMCGSCARRTYVSMERVHTDTIFKARKDSVRVRDSVVVRRLMSVRDSVAVRDSVILVKDKDGNITEKTIVRYVDRYHGEVDKLQMERTLSRYRAKIDSLEHVKRDKEAVTKLVERQPTLMERVRQGLGDIILGLVLAVALYLILMLARKYIERRFV